jgi:hypothetical protein
VGARGFVLMLAALFVLVVSLSTCRRQVPVPQVLEGPDYVAFESDRGFLVVTTSRDGLERALERVCGDIPCTFADAGDLYSVRPLEPR